MIRKLVFTIVALFGMTASAQTAKGWKECAKGDLSFIVANDLGRNGYYEQKSVAALMGEVAEGIGPEAVLALGDVHHYGGVRSVSDPLWTTNYEWIYSHPELMVDWLPVCGNHEYRGDTQAVIDYSKVSRRWNMPGRYYARTFEDDGTTVRIVFIDTTPIISKYRKKPETYPDARKQDVEAQLQWLDRTLSEATEDWIVVVGHHPVYADTDKSEVERLDMQQKVDPLLRKYNVDMYICGHIHNFQHIRRPGSGVDYVVNTSGSLARVPRKTEGTVFCSDAPGFSVLTADKKTLRLDMIDKNGNILHSVTRNHR